MACRLPTLQSCLPYLRPTKLIALPEADRLWEIHERDCGTRRGLAELSAEVSSGANTPLDFPMYSSNQEETGGFLRGIVVHGLPAGFLAEARLDGNFLSVRLTKKKMQDRD